MNNSITSKNYKKLVLQAGNGSISYCVLNVLNNSVSDIHTKPYSKTQPLEDALKDFFSKHEALQFQYDDVIVLHDNSFATFVPHALFDENYLGSYLQYNTKVFESDFYAHDAVGNYEMHNVYVPLVSINNYLIDKFGEFEYKNSNSILVSKLLDASKNIDEKLVFVHVQDTHFEIVAVRNQKLLLYNSFEYTTYEDFLYHLLFTMEQLFLNPETVKVKLLGKVDENHLGYTLAYQYIRNIALYEPVVLQDKYSINTQTALQHFTLLNA